MFWTICGDGIAAGPETCDAVDNDCNGETNEGCTPENVDITFGTWMASPLEGLEAGQHAVDLIVGEVGGLGPPVGEPAEDAMYTVEFGFFSTITP